MTEINLPHNYFIIFLLFLFFLTILPFVINFIKYRKSSYYNITKNSYLKVLFNKGFYGEYTLYKSIKNFEKDGAKFLFNLYIPTYKDKTTEIDILMICSKGIYIFESKNYSGWIFGNENEKYWTQSFHIGHGLTKKELFFNPVMQNNYHVKYLEKLIKNNLNVQSIIVFSNKCELKKIKIYNKKTIITYLCYLKTLMKNLYQNQDVILTHEQIQNLFNLLYPYSQVNENIKKQHINNIQKL